VGLADGFIEILNPITGQRRLDLTYQQNESSMMVMEHAVIALSLSHDGSILVVGTHGGEAAVWRTDTGSCLGRFAMLHKNGISVVKLSRDGQTLLTAGYDGAIRLTGLKSGRTVKEFTTQHDSFVTDVAFNRDETLLYSCGADGKLNIFDMRRSSCIKTVLPFSSDRLSHGAIQKLIPCSTTDNLMVCSRSGRVLVIGLDGKTKQEFISKHGDVVTAAASPHQRYLYLIHEKGFISCIDTDSTIVTEIECTGENIGCISHPLYNQLISFSADGALRLWNPL
jgi:WD40 repeat-containing protein SMU1